MRDGQLQNFRVLANDTAPDGSTLDIATLEILQAPQHAQSVSVQGQRIRYRADVGYDGNDSLTYRICTTAGLCDVATVNIVIDPDNPLSDVCRNDATPDIRFSLDPDRSADEELDATLFVGGGYDLYIFATAPAWATRVAFHVNDTSRIAAPLNVDRSCAWDMAVPLSDGTSRRGIDPDEFGLGIHTVTIEITGDNGQSEVFTAEFTVYFSLVSLDLWPGFVGLGCTNLQDGLPVPENSADLANCNLFRAELTDAVLADADLSAANLDEAVIADAMLDDANLSGASLVDAELTGTQVQNANLTGADLTGASAEGADFEGSDLREVWLAGADLTDVNFDGADLVGADITGANVTNTSFDNADLTDADLTDATGQPSAANPIYDDTICPDGSLTSGPTCWP